VDTKIHPVVAILVVAAAMLAVGLWAWGNGRAKAIGGPSELIIDPAGHLYIQMQNQLLEHDEQGTFIARHDLSELGVDVVIGALAFFPDGDILLRRGGDDRSFFDKLRAFLRRENQRSLDPVTAGAGLHRCQLGTRSCRRFGQEAIDFKAAYGVFIEAATSDVFVADTTRHLLRKYSASGRPVAGPVGGFRFPNHLALYDGVMLVADTNHHRIAQVDPATAAFGSQIGAIDVVPPAARADGRTWPSHFERVADAWWVNNMTASMNNGGIYLFDDDWQYMRKVDLPTGADPISLVAFNGEVLVSDWNNDAVHRVSLSGSYIGPFDSTGLAVLIQESVERRRQYLSYAWFGIAAFLTAILGTLLILVARGSLARQKNQG